MSENVAVTPTYDIGYENVSTEGTGNVTLNETINATTPRDLSWLDRDEFVAQIEIGLQAALFVMAVLSNGIVLGLLVKRLRNGKISRMYLFFMHLCIADLFVAFFNIFPQLMWDITYRFQGGNFLCKFVKYFQIVAMYASTYVLTMTAIDRFLAICYPLNSHGWSPKRAHVMVAIAWGISLAFAIPQLFLFKYEEIWPKWETGVYDCWETFSQHQIAALMHTLWMTLSVWLIPSIIIIVTYGCISYTVFQSMRRKESSRRRKPNTKSTSKNNNFRSFKSHIFGKRILANGNTNENADTGIILTKMERKSETDGISGSSSFGDIAPRAHVNNLSNAKVKTIKLTLVVAITYIICWTPLFVVQLWWAIDPTLFGPQGGLPTSIVTVLFTLGSLNSCTNPWIYFAFNASLLRSCCLTTRPDYRNTTTVSRTIVTSTGGRNSRADSAL